MTFWNLKALIIFLSATLLFKIKCSVFHDMQSYIHKNRNVFFCLNFVQEDFTDLFSFNYYAVIPWLMAYVLTQSSRFIKYF